MKGILPTGPSPIIIQPNPYNDESLLIVYLLSSYAVGQKKSTPINSNADYRREMKLIPIGVNYCLL